MRSHNRVIGMDKWELSYPYDDFLRIVKKKNWSVYEIQFHQDLISFYAPILCHRDIERTFECVRYIKTNGMLGFLFRQLHQPRRVLCLLLCIFFWYTLSHTIFTISIQGDQAETKQLIEDTLHEMGYTTPFYAKDMLVMKEEVKKKLENSIAWLEVSQEGSQYHIQFTTKEFVSLEELGHEELIAQKDGVIASFDLQHGSKQVAINDFVHKGDVLVSNVLIDSFQKNKEVYVKGKVYAYTWKDVHVEMPEDDLPEAIHFYQLLFEARREASKDLSKDERIEKENILQFQNNTGTISMDIHYTLYEDITTP